MHYSNFRTGRKATTLATHVVDLRRKGFVENNITWSKVKQINPRRKGERICGLCNTEKTLIAAGDPTILLNKRSEIMERCRHRDGLVLTNNVRSGRNMRRGFISEETTVQSSSLGSSSGVLSVPVLEVIEDPAHPSTSLPPDNSEDGQIRNVRNLNRVDYRRFY